MKIIIMDSWNGKFSKAIGEHWRSIGHQVIVNPPWDAMEQADVTFFYQSDNGLVTASTEKKPHSGKIYAHAVDIEVWAGQASAVDWSYVDKVMFMAPHIKEMVNTGSTPWKIIRPGIDIDKWTLRSESFYSKGDADPVRRIAYVVGDRRIWDVKRLDIAFQILKDLMQLDRTHIWQLHMRGSYSSHAQYNAFCQYLEKDLVLEGHVFWYSERIENMNEWLEDKDFYLLPSTKEAFSYATAETMCKGIKPIINNWQGSKEVWGKYVSETIGGMLTNIVNGEYAPEEYRQYIIDHYDQKRYFKEIDEWFELGGEQT